MRELRSAPINSLNARCQKVATSIRPHSVGETVRPATLTVCRHPTEVAPRRCSCLTRHSEEAVLGFGPDLVRVADNPPEAWRKHFER